MEGILKAAHQKAITSLQLLNKDKYLVSASIDGVIKVWNFQDKNELFSFDFVF